ncbi:MAG: DUF2313 domain-containing protein [Peptococcaceae bacterium]|nr:DUF2313 domain-containing protein [Peptococcaceae bacterium]MBQ2994182.1 DUF2313 domain-containing protein [Peptococcaceae bacterium]
MRNLIDELPSYWHEVPEMQELQRVIQKLFEGIETESDKILLDAFIDTASEERISEWEKRLTITPTGTLEQRRLYLKAVIRGFGKLNEEKIKSIVNALTGGDAIVTFEAGVITVRVLPPNNGEVYLFPDVERAIEPRKPAHLGLSVVRYYSTWDIIENRFATWDEIKAHFEDWEEVRNYIEG